MCLEIDFTLQQGRDGEDRGSSKKSLPSFGRHSVGLALRFDFLRLGIGVRVARCYVRPETVINFLQRRRCKSPPLSTRQLTTMRARSLRRVHVQAALAMFRNVGELLLPPIHNFTFALCCGQPDFSCSSGLCGQHRRLQCRQPRISHIKYSYLSHVFHFGCDLRYLPCCCRKTGSQAPVAPVQRSFMTQSGDFINFRCSKDFCAGSDVCRFRGDGCGRDCVGPNRTCGNRSHTVKR